MGHYQDTPRLIFFRQLHKMLTDETRSKSGCIVWISDGLGFVISSRQVLSNIILPRYFGHSSFASFARRLKRWGFTFHGGIYYHTQFKRDKIFENNYFPSLLSKGPPKKRFKQTTPPKHSMSQVPSDCSSPEIRYSVVDMNVMTKLMRTVDIEQRKERHELALLQHEIVTLSQMIERIEDVLVTRAIASLELQVRKKASYYSLFQSQLP